MTCPNCKTLSCYVCKVAITGYDHFHQNVRPIPIHHLSNVSLPRLQDPRNAGGSSANTKCPLWDSVDHRHDQEVKEAYQKALEDYKRDHPDVEIGKDFKIDLPKSPPKQPNALPAGYIDPNALAGGGGGWGVGVGWAGGRAWGLPPAPRAQRQLDNAAAAAMRVEAERVRVARRVPQVVLPKRKRRR